MIFNRQPLNPLWNLIRTGAAAAVILSLAAGAAVAQQWPDRPVKIIVPYAPGGSNDVLARKLADGLSKNTGQSFLIENKAGAGGALGANFVATSAPDGYTFLFVSSSLTTSAATQKTPYDIRTSFTPISEVATAAFMVVVRDNFPAKDLAGLLKYAKENPGKVNFGTPGLGDIGHMASELLAIKTGTKMTAVPYKGIGPSQIDLVAGRLDMLITTMTSLRGTPADQLPKFAYTGAQREPDYPNIPTVKEVIGQDYAVNVWWGMFGPAGMEPAIRDRFNAEIKKIVATEDFAKFLKSVNANPQSSPAEEFRKIVISDLDRWIDTAKTAGIRLE